MSDSFGRFLLGAAINLAVAVFIVRGIYYPRTRERKYVFTFITFSTVIYFVLALLTTANLSVGVGFGLFAIFSVLRYRTDPIPIREMTYLFVILSLPVVNSVLGALGSYRQMAVANGVVIAVLYLLEREWGFRFEASRRITYDRIDLIPPTRRAELLEDLRRRTGLPVARVEVGRLDLLRDTADIRVFYAAAPGAPLPSDPEVTGGDDDDE